MPPTAEDIIDETTSKGHNGSGSAGEHADAALEDVARAASDAAGALSDAIREGTDELADALRALVREKPLAALAVAAGVAYLVGRLRH